MELGLVLKRAFYVALRKLTGHRVLHMVLADLSHLPDVEIPEGYEFRCYRDGDDDGWVRLINSSMNPVWTRRRFRNEILSKLASRPENLIMATRAGEIVGTACALEDGVIHLVAVHPGHRGRQLGRLVSLAALHRLRELGHQSATLITDTAREPAIRLYKKLGFEVID